VAAIRGLASGFRRTGEAIASRSLCAPDSVQARLSQLDAATVLRTAKRALRSQGYRFELELPRPVETPDRSLPTGSFIVASDLSGQGRWQVSNGLARDAVVAITHVGATEALHSVYIAAGEEYTLTGIPDGTYALYFTIGRDWNDAIARFTRECEFTEFEDAFKFETTATQYTGWEVTLNPVQGGTARSDPVEPDSFPRLG
jgi:hypothetical protein